MSQNKQNDAREFHWEPQPAAAELVSELIGQFVAENHVGADLAQRMQRESGTRLVDWVDSLVLADNEAARERLAAGGFQKSGESYEHPGGLFPQIFGDASSPESSQLEVFELAIQVDSVEDFAAVWQTSCDTDFFGQPGDLFRACRVTSIAGTTSSPTLLVVERHGCSDRVPNPATEDQIAAAAKHCRVFCERERGFSSEQRRFKLAESLFEIAAEELGQSWACDLFFAAERKYWMRRNHAARVQYARQQQLGLGWANHDHHTYRSSREHFHLLISVLEAMGFECREQFYAGQEAGWGAQVLQHRECGLVVFADVDLSPDEISGDISHDPLPAREELGTVGLWCALHGESFLQAGLHHLECRFDFDASREQLASVEVETMAPFTNFPHLKQAFTQGEVWAVDSQRVDKLLEAGHITPSQAKQFQQEGTIGSHLEILERNDGYKGFNQTGVSDIISRTDPRKW